MGTSSLYISAVKTMLLGALGSKNWPMSGHIGATNGCIAACGWRMWWSTYKKVYRLYCEEKLKLRVKKGKRIKSEKRGDLPELTAPNQLWTMDFVHDALCDGRSFRTFNILDAYTRQCLHIEADTSLSGERVVRVLEDLLPKKGEPQFIQIDNGPEFRGHKMDVWAYQNQVKLRFIDPGKPSQNGHIESFNGKSGMND